jgi:hypothetical protein
MEELLILTIGYSIENMYQKTKQDLIEIHFGKRRMYDFKTLALRNGLRSNQVCDHSFGKGTILFQ